MSDGTVGVGIIGLGTVHDGHVRGFQQASDTCRIVAVCDLDAAVVGKRAGELGAAAYTDYRELVASDDVDLVDVILPHNLHFPVVSYSLAAGKHTLVEKPMAVTRHEARQLLELAAEQDLCFTVAENTRFVAAYIRAIEVLESGVIGTPRLVRTLICGSEVQRLSRPESWKGRRDGSVGGAILDAGPHSFYLLEWLIAPVAELTASTAKLIETSEVEDYGIVSGRLENGSRFTSEFTFTAAIPWNERLEIYGTHGSLIIDQLSNPPAMLFRGTSAEPEPVADVPYAPRSWKRASIADGVEDFVRSVHSGRRPAVDPESGSRTLVLVESAYASASSRQPMPVEV
jgi:UDP-N-acetylglucosamine 3-dehydrogenase